MKNRITTTFQQKNKNILSIFFTAGYPNLNDTLSIVENLEKAGVDMIEIGIPFSDPLADGPVIQESSEKALKNGMSLTLLFDQLTTLRKNTTIPIVLMGYLNPILQYGEENFVKKCAEVGIDGFIIPDLPLDYYKQHLKAYCQQYGILNIMLINNETAEERIKMIDQETDGFIYMVSSNSITGANKNLEKQTDYFQRIQNLQLTNPRLVGFGIHNAATFQTVCEYSQGAIVGSAFVKHIEYNGISLPAIQEFVNSLKH